MGSRLAANQRHANGNTLPLQELEGIQMNLAKMKMPIQELRDEIAEVRKDCEAAYATWTAICKRLEKLERQYTTMVIPNEDAQAD